MAHTASASAPINNRGRTNGWMFPVRDQQGRFIRIATAARRLLVFREDADMNRAYGCVRCTGILQQQGAGLRGGITEADVIAFLARHPRPYIHVIRSWDGPGSFPIYVPFMHERIEEGVSAIDMYCRGETWDEWIRVTVMLRRWPPPYSRPESAESPGA